MYVWWFDDTPVAHISLDEWLGIDLSLHHITKQQNSYDQAQFEAWLKP